mgnify:CR=1 FL=1
MNKSAGKMALSALAALAGLALLVFVALSGDDIPRSVNGLCAGLGGALIGLGGAGLIIPLPTRRGVYPCDLWTCPVGEEPCPVSLSDDRVLFLNLPGEAERGELTLRSGQGQQTAWAQAESRQCAFTFDTPMEADCATPESHWGVEGWPYVLRLYGGQEELLLEQEGEIPLFPHRQGQAYFTDDCYEEYCRRPG